MFMTRARLSSRLLALPIVLLTGNLLARQAELPAPAEITAARSRTVLITGANRGIGLEFARQYAAAGWRVIGTARKPDAAAELHALTAQVVQLDVSDPSSVDRLASDLAGTPIDLLINNAGIQPLMWKLAEVDFDAFERGLAVNTVGPVRVTRALLPNLRSGECLASLIACHPPTTAHSGPMPASKWPGSEKPLFQMIDAAMDPETTPDRG
jgi:NAD(P)-dependent dehydrogenase (short-subunit alcohol dehydrogenase family)